jgi:hypothetical protein
MVVMKCEVWFSEHLYLHFASLEWFAAVCGLAPTLESLQFKFILKCVGGKILWQPGAGQILQTWETEKTIEV